MSWPGPSGRQIDCQLDQATLAMSESAFRKVFQPHGQCGPLPNVYGFIRIPREGQKLRIENPCQPMSDQALLVSLHFQSPGQRPTGNKGTGLGLYMVHNLLENHIILPMTFYAIEGMRFGAEVPGD